MKRATLSDVARLAGVSKATASYVINNSKKTISEETRERVRRAAEELDYVPNLGAASLTSNSSRLIGVVVPQTEPGSELMFHNSFYSEIVSSIEYFARQRGYHIIISATDVNESYMRLVYERSLDGVIVIGMYPDDFYQQFKQIEVPVVLIDSYCRDAFFHNIRIDDELGGYMSARHLIDCGHRRIGFLCGQTRENGVIKKRLDGYRRALIEGGIEYDEAMIYEGTVDYESGRRIASEIVKRGDDITALTATADILAIGAIRGFADEGKSVPDDYSVIGFDDLEIASYTQPRLTTIHQEISQKGERAMEILAESMDDPNMERCDITLPFSLIERESVRRI